ncbi:hypothetical protein FOA52_008091 [Chlamydomonas sp. UWO 241]|nr:hypothetical protein FOA52_008091 [Chlamydomonas sp. UWO 241]
MADTTVQFGHISIASREGGNQGPLKVSPTGMAWRSSAGGKVVEIKKDNMEALYWTKTSRACQLGVRTKDGPTTNFLGFREKDLESLREIATGSLGLEIKDLPMALSGRNWGALAINNGSLMFTVDNKVAMEMPLRDVSNAQQAKDDVQMELHVDDTTTTGSCDVLCEMSFHIPPGNEHFFSDEVPAAKNLLDQVLKHTDTGAAASDEAVCAFGDVAILNPRGRFEIELHLSSLSLAGQTQDFKTQDFETQDLKIRYSSIQRLFILPKANTPHTLVVVSLDPPIRKGQTYYTHLLCQFPTDADENIELDITADQLAAKNEKCGGKLATKISGPVWDVFAKALRGLSGAKISKTGVFSNSADEPAIRCAYKSDDGLLYPLDRAFFFIHKPPMLLPFDEVESVEFARQGGGVVSSRTFDLVVRMKSDAEHQFRNISRTEWQALFDFINAKKLRIENLASAAQGPGGPTRVEGVDDDDIDPGMRRAEAEIDTEEDDEDFEVGAGDEGASSDGGSDGDSGSGSDAEMVEEEGVSVADFKAKKGSKRGRGSDAGSDDDDDGGSDAGPSSPPAPKAKKGKAEKEEKAPKEKKTKKETAKEEKEEKGGKKKRAKKDPNEPKRGLSAFMFFSTDQRAKIKEENPGIAFGEMGKALGEKWKALSDEGKVKYNEQAAKDKERYTAAMKAYKSGGGAKEEVKAEEGDGFIDDDVDEEEADE